MDYVERLLLRALAVPRDSAPSLFDPFEQVAPWDLDAPASRAANAPALVRPSAPSVPSRDSVPSAVEEPGLPPAEPLHPESASMPAPSSPPALVAEGPDRPPPLKEAPGERALVAPRSARDRAPLDRADAFMRALGVKIEHADAATQGAQTSVEAPARHETPQPAAPARTVATDPAHLWPVAKPIPVGHPAEPQREGPRAKVPSPSTIPAEGARAAPGPAKEPGLVQTTVVVAPPSRLLEDLAHSSGISRFGLGQG